MHVSEDSMLWVPWKKILETEPINKLRNPAVVHSSIITFFFLRLSIIPSEARKTCLVHIVQDGCKPAVAG